MTMKFIPAAMALILTAGTAHAVETPVSLESGKVNFTGSVVNTACAVDAASTNLNVNMGQVRLASLGTTVGTLANARTDFQIKLVDCDTATYKNAQITFNGVTSQDNNTVLEAGQGAGKATGVGIQIFDHTGKALSISTASEAITLIDGTNTLHFQSGYISTLAAPTAGDASASSTFTVTYS